MEGTLASLLKVRPDLLTQADAISSALKQYKALFYVQGLNSAEEHPGVV